MNIGNVIKSLRRERGITQEELAEYLHISASAISQWETGKAAPDIAQLPILANIFQVTTDELLSVNVSRNEERIKEVCENAEKLFSDGYNDEAISALRCALLEFPNSMRIMEYLAYFLYCCSRICTADEPNGLRAEALALAEKVMDECDDIDIKVWAARIAVDIYMETGREDDAEDAAKIVPENFSREDLLAYVYKGEKLAQLYKNHIMEQMTCALFEAGQLKKLRLADGRELYTDAEKMQISEKIIEGYKLLFEDGDYHFYAQFLSMEYSAVASLFAKNGDNSKALEALREALRYAVLFDTYEKNAEKTSLLVRGLKACGVSKSSPDDTWWAVRRLSEEMAEGEFDSVRGESEFAVLEAEIADCLRK